MTFVMDNFDNIAKWQEVTLGTGIIQNKQNSSFQASVSATGDRAGLQSPTKIPFPELTDLRLKLDRKCALAGINLAWEEQSDPMNWGYGYAFYRDAIYGVIVWFEGSATYIPDTVPPDQLAELRITNENGLLSFYYNDQLILQQQSSGWSNAYYVKIAASSDRTDTFIPGTNNFASTGYVPPTFTLTISATLGGSTIPSVENYVYSAGTSVSVQAVPAIGYNFDHWELDGANVGSTNPYPLTMNADHILNAIFSLIPTLLHTLSVNSTPISGVPLTIKKVS